MCFHSSQYAEEVAGANPRWRLLLFALVFWFFIDSVRGCLSSRVRAQSDVHSAPGGLVCVFPSADGAAVAGFSGLIRFARIMDAHPFAVEAVLSFVFAHAASDARRFRSMVFDGHFSFLRPNNRMKPMRVGRLFLFR